MSRGLLAPPGLVHAHTRDFEMSSRFYACPSLLLTICCQVLKVTSYLQVILPSQGSQISSSFHPRINTWYILAGVLHCHMAATTQLSGSVMLFLSSHDINSLRCLSAAETAEGRARQYCSFSASHGENIISSLPLPCQVPVSIWHTEYVYYQLTTWTILDFLLHLHSCTHKHIPHSKTPTGHQVSDCEHSILWEVHCHLRVQKLQMADWETIQSCFASGEIRQKEVLEIGSEQGTRTVNLFTSDRHLALALILLFSFLLLCLWCVFFSYLSFFIRHPANQFSPRCSPKAVVFPFSEPPLQCGQLAAMVNWCSSPGVFRTGYVSLELRVGYYLLFSESHCPA